MLKRTHKACCKALTKVIIMNVSEIMARRSFNQCKRDSNYSVDFDLTYKCWSDIVRSC